MLDFCPSWVSLLTFTLDWTYAVGLRGAITYANQLNYKSTSVISDLSLPPDLKVRRSKSDNSWSFPAHDVVIEPKPAPNSFVVVLIVALSLAYYKRNRYTFLHTLANSIRWPSTKCYETDNKQTHAHGLQLKIYCIYFPKDSRLKQPAYSRAMYVPVKAIVDSLTGGQMHTLLQDYNVTSFTQESDPTLSSTSFAVREESWFPVLLAAVLSFVFVLVASLTALLCCKRRCCLPVNDGRRKSAEVNSKHQDFLYQPIQTIETMSPHRVQPHPNAMYSISGSPPKAQQWSKDRKRNLYQQRVGSQSSLVLDLSPMTQSTELEYHIESSPTEDVLANKSKLLSFNGLKKVIKAKKALYAEFWSIPPNTTSRKEKIFMSSLKNRYPDIIPNTKSAVTLQQLGHDPYSTYINANFIKGYNQQPNYFIATEGPLQSTIHDFWRMMWEYQCSVIIMITALKRRNEEKCTQYWPTAGPDSEITYGSITITYHSDTVKEGYRVTKVIMKQPFHEPRLVTHYWLASWPDHEVPKSCSCLLALVDDYRRSHNPPSGPTVVHCSAGRGRTGCFIAIAIGMDMIDNEGQVDILKLVSTMRIDRGGMVEKDGQYTFIHLALYEYWKRHRPQSGPLMSADDTLIEEAEEAQEGSRNVFAW